MTPADQLARVVLSFMWLPVALFVSFYASLSPWRSSKLGRAMMHMFVALLVTMVISLVDVWTDSWPYDEWAHLFVYSWLTATTWRMFLVLRYYQQNEGAEEKKDDERANR